MSVPPPVPAQRPFLIRLFGGLYRLIDGSRRFVMNVIFVIIVIWILGAIFTSLPPIQERTALVLAPEGAIVEQYTGSPAERAKAQLLGDEIHEVQLRDIVRALEAAAKDPNIARVVLVVDEISDAGLSTLREVAAALEAFRASGKEIIAYAEALDQRGYFLAAFADQVYLNPEGGILFEGLSRYRTYYRGAFDKLGVEPHLFRVGEYKSAGESYVRSDQSPESREADTFWMSDLWQQYLATIAERRKLDAATLQANIEGYVDTIKAAGGDLATMAKAQGLVDDLKTRDEVRAMLIERGALDEDKHTFRQINLDNYLTHLDATTLPGQPAPIAVVVAEGEIVGGDQPPGLVGGDSTARLLRTAREDEDVKAVVLRVDSPGGEVFASEIIRREVELTQQAGKPVVVSMGDLAASGGYWISMNADEIIASPSTITGSIGIFGLWFSAPDGWGKLGLNTDGVGTNWISGAVNPTRPYDPRLGEIIQTVIDRGYQQFIGKVAQARDKESTEIDRIGRGRVWSGAQALERGLVDELGTLQDAIAAAAERADLGEDRRIRYIEPEPSSFERLLASLSGSGLARWVRASDWHTPAAWLPREQARELARAQRVVQDVISRKNVTLYAHCECAGF
jgi:protease-4